MPEYPSDDLLKLAKCTIYIILPQERIIFDFDYILSMNMKTWKEF